MLTFVELKKKHHMHVWKKMDKTIILSIIAMHCFVETNTDKVHVPSNVLVAMALPQIPVQSDRHLVIFKDSSSFRNLSLRHNHETIETSVSAIIQDGKIQVTSSLPLRQCQLGTPAERKSAHCSLYKKVFNFICLFKTPRITAVLQGEM